MKKTKSKTEESWDFLTKKFSKKELKEFGIRSPRYYYLRRWIINNRDKTRLYVDRYRNKNKGKDGFVKMLKKCHANQYFRMMSDIYLHEKHKEYHRRWAAKKRRTLGMKEMIPRPIIGTKKQCSMCGEMVDVSLFWRSNEKGRKPRIRSACNKCSNKRRK